MKKLAAVITATFIFLTIFSGLFAKAQQALLYEALAAAKSELYGMYTMQSGNLLRDRYDRAISEGAGNDEASALLAALNSLIPLDNYTREPLLGFASLSDEDIAKMPLCNGDISVSEGVITLSGSESLRYSNALSDGISGPSPFGVACPDADGFVLKITSESNAFLDLEIGRRGSSSDCLFLLPNISVSAGEKYYFFPFSRFGELPLDGTLNYISLTFSGTSTVSFSDLHAASNTTENLATYTYSETPFAGLPFDSQKYYKFYQKNTNLALTLLDKPNSYGDITEFSEGDPDNDAQLWSIHLLPDSNNSYLIINKHFGTALKAFSETNLVIDTGCPDLTSPLQLWRFTYSKSKGYSVGLKNICNLSYAGGKPKLYAPSSPLKYFDIAEVHTDEWNLVWSDEFNGNELDRSVWFPRHGHNSDPTDPYYYPEDDRNICLEDGNLILKTVIEECNGFPSTAAHITTEDKLLLTYGRIEMRAKMPAGNKLFPAFWMMGEDDQWPYSGEIDIIEMVSSDAYDNYFGSRRAIATFHYADTDGRHAEKGGSTDGILMNTENLSDDYHLYAVEWEADQLRWYFDDIHYFTLNIDTPELANALSENPMFLRLNTGFDGPGNYVLPENIPQETEFCIDYVRYYKNEKTSLRAESQNVYTLDQPDCFEIIWSPANSGAASMQNDILIYGNAANYSRVFNLKTFEKTASATLSGIGWTKAIAISADGNTIAFGREAQVTVTDRNFNTLKTLTTGSYYPTLALSNNGAFLYIGGIPDTSDPDYCKFFRVIDVAEGEEILKEATESWVDSIAVASNGTYAYGCFDGTVRIRSAENELIGSFNLDGRVVSLVFSEDSKKLYATDIHSDLTVFNIEAGSSSSIPCYAEETYAIALSPDGSRLAVACGDSYVRILDTSTHKLIAAAPLGNLAVTSITFSADGNLIAAGGTDGKIGVFRASDGIPLLVLTDRNNPVCWYNTVTFSSDASTVMAIRGYEDFNSAVSGWKLPENLITASADFTSLEALPYADELIYTSKSYAEYSATLKNAHTVKNNRYSSQAQINEASAALQNAFAALERKPSYLKGDFDFDEQISVADALAALRIAAKMTACTETDLLIGDIDKDGNITVSDALAILRVAAKMADSL